MPANSSVMVVTLARSRDKIASAKNFLFAYIVLLYFSRYHETITYYEKALAVSTRSLSTYAGLAYTYHLQDNFTAAITYYHMALWLKPDNQFCTEKVDISSGKRMLPWCRAQNGFPSKRFIYILRT
ncbi:hypothetical protein RHSIM_Rhsim02G0051300 [Rhododendron simsii]|uniref:Uncharacterized protein n=1 Tax=Rhododendron simsii TaxID=118357 RepID=A0A834HA74_RHOSS|nr:hypothetical protein RHSIM_Rhsim02G0051300 [Rhododendron simsii]